MKDYSSKSNLPIATIFSVMALVVSIGLQTGVGMAQSGSPIVLGLGDVVERVQQENLEVLLTREGIEEAMQEVARQRASLIPSVNLNVSQSRSQFVNTGRGFNVPGGSAVTPPSNRFDATLQGNVNLFNTNLIAAFRSAKLGLELSELQYQTVLQDVMEAAASAFIIHLRNVAAMEVIEANIERNRSLLNLARDRANSGVATQIDVTRAEVALARSEQDRLQQDTVLLDSELRLKRLLNLDLDSVIVLKPLASRLQSEAISPPPPSGIDAILDNRTEYQAALRRKRLSEIARRAAIWQRAPDVSLFATYGLVSDEAFSGNYDNGWSAGVQLTVPIFDGFRIRSDRLRAESAIRAQELSIRILEQQLGSEYRLQVQQVRSSFEQIAVARKFSELSRRELDLATTRFERGVADNREVIDAQNNLAFAETNFLEALYSYGLARLGLARTLGEVESIVDLENGS